jgi:DNA-binding transcriptional MerR regulator
MRISELSQASGVPIPTVKYYLRESMLPPGQLTSPNQARYSEQHLQRLRLVRVLIEVGGLSIAAVRDVLAAIADEGVAIPKLLASVQYAMVAAQPREDPAWQEARKDVDEYVAGLGWQITADAPARNQLAEVLHGLRTLSGEPISADCFAPYAKLAQELAADEIASLPGPDAPRDEIVVQVTVGIAVFESALTALRLLAEEDATARRYGGTTLGAPPEDV